MGDHTPFISHMPQRAIGFFWHNEHDIASMRSARWMHAHIEAVRSNDTQRIAPMNKQEVDKKYRLSQYGGGCLAGGGRWYGGSLGM